MKRDFWSESRVLMIGGGNWGSVLGLLAAPHCKELRVWMRSEEQARAINSTRTNERYLPKIPLPENIKAYYEPDRAFEMGVDAVIWALPSSACRPMAKEFAKYFSGQEILIHATKGVEQGTLKRISEILREEMPCPRVGVLSGPNLSDEIARGEPAATVVASDFAEVREAGMRLFSSKKFRVVTSADLIGVEWAGTLKNVLSIASGALNSLGLGMNVRAMLIAQGLAEMVRFGEAMGGREATFLGLAGVGDLLATASSPLSRNYQVGFKLGQGIPLDTIVKELNVTAEGVATTRNVARFALERDIRMPITQGVASLLRGEKSARAVIDDLMIPWPDES